MSFSKVTAMTEIRLEARAHYSKPKLYLCPHWTGQNLSPVPFLFQMDVLRAGWAAAQGTLAQVCHWMSCHSPPDERKVPRSLHCPHGVDSAGEGFPLAHGSIRADTHFYDRFYSCRLCIYNCLRRCRSLLGERTESG